MVNFVLCVFYTNFLKKDDLELQRGKNSWIGKIMESIKAILHLVDSLNKT